MDPHRCPRTEQHCRLIDLKKAVPHAKLCSGSFNCAANEAWQNLGPSESLGNFRQTCIKDAGSADPFVSFFCLPPCFDQEEWGGDEEEEAR